MKSRGFWIWLIVTLGILPVVLLLSGMQFSRDGFKFNDFVFGSALIGQVVPAITYMVYYCVKWMRTPIDARRSPFRIILMTLLVVLLSNLLAMYIVYLAPLYSSQKHPFAGSGNFGGLLPIVSVICVSGFVLIVSPFLGWIMHAIGKKQKDSRKYTIGPEDVLDHE